MSAANGAGYGTDGFTEPWGLARDAAEQGDEADEAFGGMVARMDMPPHARAGGVGRGHRFKLIPGVGRTWGWRAQAIPRKAVRGGSSPVAGSAVAVRLTGVG